MSVTHNSAFSTQNLTAAINQIEPTPTQIRELGIFEPYYGTKKVAMIEYKESGLSIVKNSARGKLGGEATDASQRKAEYFEATHLTVTDNILAEDYQDVREFGGNELTNFKNVITEYQNNAKLKLEMTREHLMLGALQGKILDKDGTVIHDLYDKFGLKRPAEISFDLSKDDTKVGLKMDTMLSELRQGFKGAAVTGFVALCGSKFLTELKYHKSIEPLYTRFRDGAVYRESNGINPIEFEHNGVKFIEYTGNFGSKGAKIATNQAILIPVGKKLYLEYFAPADMAAAVNTKALPYYSTMDTLGGNHDLGVSVRSQSNPLPIALRPDVIRILTV